MESTRRRIREYIYKKGVSLTRSRKRSCLFNGDLELPWWQRRRSHPLPACCISKDFAASSWRHPNAAAWLPLWIKRKEESELINKLAKPFPFSQSFRVVCFISFSFYNGALSLFLLYIKKKIPLASTVYCSTSKDKEQVEQSLSFVSWRNNSIRSLIWRATVCAVCLHGLP